MGRTFDQIRNMLFGKPGNPGDVYTKGASGKIEPVDPGSIGVLDHGGLTGLSDDDHTQYALDAGTSTTNGLVKFSGTDGRTLADTTLTSTGGGLYVPSNLSVDGNGSVLGSLSVSGGTSGIGTLPGWHVSDGTLTGVVVANSSGTAGSGTAALAANRLYLMPLLIPARKPTIDQLLFEVTALTGGTNSARIGMYAATSATNWMPSGAPLADSGDINVGTTGSIGVKTYSVSVSPNPGLLYWLAIGSDGTPTIRTLGSNAYYPMPVDPTNLSTRRFGLQIASWTYAALPSSPSCAWLTSATVMPLLAVRCSA